MKSKKTRPLRIGVAGLVHTHVHWILGREDRGDIEIVGIAEPNTQLAQRYADQHGYSMDIVYPSLESMLDATKPEAVTAFNTIYDHLKVVEICAPRGIHVMVEKPLAVSWDHAQKMAETAREHNIHLLTNYETSWYGTTRATIKEIYESRRIGDLRRIVFQTGHPGPVEIGCNEEFLEWLTDPVLNGGGALTDFGCYGANIATWLFKGARPTAVTCITQQIKPHLYPKVEDDATIVLTYPEAQVIIQASWNWPHNRKDMTVYGKTGYIQCDNSRDMRIMQDENTGPILSEAPTLPIGFDDPFAFMYKVIRENHPIGEYDLSSLENNLIVMQILEAAKESAASGKTIKWQEKYGIE